MKLTEERLTAVKELVRIADGMASNSMPLLQGARKLIALRHAFGDPDNPLFLPIIAFESETDAFPIGEYRQFWSSEALERLDLELAEYIMAHENSVKAACIAIVRAFGRGGGRNEDGASF